MAINTSIRVNDSWKAGTPYVKVNSVWKEAATAYVKVNGVWKECASSSIPTYYFGEYPRWLDQSDTGYNLIWGTPNGNPDSDFNLLENETDPWSSRDTIQRCLLGAKSASGTYTKAAISKGDVFKIEFLSVPLLGKSQRYYDCYVTFNSGTVIFYEPNSYTNYSLFTYNGTYIKGYS